MTGTARKSYRNAFSRRAFLGAGIGGLSWPGFYRAQALADIVGEAPSDTAVIQYWLNGYPLDDQGIHRFFPRRSAYLGVSHNPIEILKARTGDGKDPGQDKDFRVHSLDPIGDLTRQDLLERRALLDGFNGIGRESHHTQTDLWDHSYHAAFDLITGEATGAAFNLEKEDSKTRERYGHHRSGQTALLARRLVESGVTFVTVIDPGVGLGSSGWDLHTKLEWGTKTASPPMDQAVTTLIEGTRAAHKN